MSWQNSRQLASLQKGSSVVNYSYDVNGQRVKKTAGTDTVDFYYDDNGRLIKQESDGGYIWFYYNPSGAPASMSYHGTHYYFLKNLQGDVIGLVNMQGTVVARYTYDAWGNLLYIFDGSGNMVTDPNHIANQNPIRYRGYYYDTESGLYYLNSRYYDPVTGRFINLDNQISSASDLTGLNLFSYCGNNPVNRADPTGHAWWHWALAAAVVVVAAVAVVATAGGVVAGVAAVGAVASGCAATSTAATVAAGAFIGSATAFGLSAISAATSSKSVSEFNAKGNWGTVAGTAAGAAIGGAGAYASSSSQSRRQKSYSPPKVKKVVQNNVVNAKNVGSALKTDPHHAFPKIVDNYAGYATQTPVPNGTLYQIKGSLNGVSGRFEWIVQDGQVTHRMFVKGGGINGIPIVP